MFKVGVGEMYFYKGIFDRVLKEFPGSIIAGGALRDCLIGTPIADIDVWTENPPYLEEFKSCSNADEYIASPLTNDPPLYISLVVSTNLSGIGFPINLIVIKRIASNPQKIRSADLFEMFDYGICMIAYSEKEGLVVSDKFLKDVELQRFTHYGKSKTKPARIEKLKKKFPGWSIDPSP